MRKDAQNRARIKSEQIEQVKHQNIVREEMRKEEFLESMRLAEERLAEQ